MTPQTALFIGGESDGMRWAMPELPSEIRLPVKTASNLNVTGDAAPFILQRYLRREVIDSDNSVFHLYVSDVDRPLHRLADGYQSNRLMDDAVKHLTAIVEALDASTPTPWPLVRAVREAEVFLLKNNLTAG